SMCIIKEVIPYNKECTDLFNILFFVVELLLNIFICCSIWLTIKLFGIAIKLNTDSDYFFAEYDRYIEKRLIEIHSRNIRNSDKKLKNEPIEKFVKDNNKYFSFDSEVSDDYIPIKANKSGIFKSYSC